MTGDLRLRSGVSASSAISTLEQLVFQVRNLSQSGGGIEIDVIQNNYLGWVETAERSLRNYFISPWTWDGLNTGRLKEIRLLSENTARPFPLITLEAEVQADRLTSIVDRLEQSLARFELPADCVAIVPDTNILLHYQFFMDVDWPMLAHAKEVRLTIPLLVVEELDQQSYKSQPHSQRAKGVLRALRGLLADLPTPETATNVRSGVTLQFLMDPPGHQRSTNHDDEFLDRAEDLLRLVDERLLVATGDLSMQLRASLRGLKCLILRKESSESGAPPMSPTRSTEADSGS